MNIRRRDGFRHVPSFQYIPTFRYVHSFNELDAELQSASAFPSAATATSARPPFTLRELVGASVASGLLVWGITRWLDGGTR